MLTQQFGESAGVYARDGGDALTLQPAAERLLGIPVAVLLAVVGYNEALNMPPAPGRDGDSFRR